MLLNEQVTESIFLAQRILSLSRNLSENLNKGNILFAHFSLQYMVEKIYLVH